jgi:hypothetical protein
MHTEQLIEILKKHIPPEAAPLIANWLQEHKVSLIIKWNRSSKLGDYRAPFQGKSHQITINHQLNKYAFLLTLVHELAHLTTHTLHGHRVQAHGNEWKMQFKYLMQPFLTLKIFPIELEAAIKAYLILPKASSCGDPNLMRVLATYDTVRPVFVEHLPERTHFSLDDERVFEKGKKLRKNYECLEIKSQRKYLVSAIATVKKVHESKPSVPASPAKEVDNKKGFSFFN